MYLPIVFEWVANSHFSHSESSFRLLKNSLTIISVLVIYRKPLFTRRLLSQSSWTISQELVKISVSIYLSQENRNNMLPKSHNLADITSNDYLLSQVHKLLILKWFDAIQLNKINFDHLKKEIFWTILMWDFEGKNILARRMKVCRVTIQCLYCRCQITVCITTLKIIDLFH